MSQPHTSDIASSPATKWLQWGVIALVALMPFHAFLTTWGSSLVGHRSLLQAWKEILLLTMLVAAGWQVWQEPRHWRIIKRPLNLAILAFAVLTLLVSLLFGHFGKTFWLGAKIDLEFLLAFVLVQFVASSQLEKLFAKLLIVTSSLIAGIGLLQAFILPADFLKHFGYNATTIQPYRLVDPAVGNIRILATLGGPNQLGTFMILPICLFAFLLVRKRWWWAALPLAAGTLTLINSYSRSAWLGSIVAVLITLAVGVSRRWVSGLVIAGVVIALALLGLGRHALLKNTNFEYFLLHGHIQFGQVRGSDEGRIKSLQTGVATSLHHPLGEGLGASGPATLGSETASITENYYLQIAIELGLVGLLLFLAIQGGLAYRLWHIGTHSELAPALLGTLGGMAVVNLFLHGWADSSTALVYWTIAGCVIANHARGSHGTTR